MTHDLMIHTDAASAVRLVARTHIPGIVTSVLTPIEVVMVISPA